jgi:hypothetical protein
MGGAGVQFYGPAASSMAAAVDPMS